MTMKAVALLSGGLDSATSLAFAIRAGRKVTALHVNYGQRHSREYYSAQALARHFDVHLIRVDVNMPVLNSALTNFTIDVPREGVQPGIPVTYVPARNTFLLGIAASIAESIGAELLYVGFNAVDYSGYPDCRPEFVAAMNKALMAGMKKEVTIVAPVINMTKIEIIQRGTEYGVPFEHTWSCYVGEEKPCGECDSCRIRNQAFHDIGIQDPLNARA